MAITTHGRFVTHATNLLDVQTVKRQISSSSYQSSHPKRHFFVSRSSRPSFMIDIIRHTGQRVAIDTIMSRMDVNERALPEVQSLGIVETLARRSLDLPPLQKMQALPKPFRLLRRRHGWRVGRDRRTVRRREENRGEKRETLTRNEARQSGILSCACRGASLRCQAWKSGIQRDADPR